MSVNDEAQFAYEWSQFVQQTLDLTEDELRERFRQGLQQINHPSVTDEESFEHLFQLCVLPPDKLAQRLLHGS